MSDLLALAERCEASTGPDRELDHSIYEILGKPVVPIARATAYGVDCCTWAPFYTASIDAAERIGERRLRVGQHAGVRRLTRRQPETSGH